MKKANTTEADFAVFCESIEFYMNLLQLGDWKHLCYHSDKGVINSYASIRTDYAARLVTFFFAKTLTEAAIAHCDPWLHGKHEVCELLLSELSNACAHAFNNNDVDSWSHAVIHRLERALPAKEIVQIKRTK